MNAEGRVADISVVLLNVLALPAATIVALIMGFMEGQSSGPKAAFKTGWENVKNLNKLINEHISEFKQGQTPLG